MILSIRNITLVNTIRKEEDRSLNGHLTKDQRYIHVRGAFLI